MRLFSFIVRIEFIVSTTYALATEHTEGTENTESVGRSRGSVFSLRPVASVAKAKFAYVLTLAQGVSLVQHA